MNDEKTIQIDETAAIPDADASKDVKTENSGEPIIRAAAPAADAAGAPPADAPAEITASVTDEAPVVSDVPDGGADAAAEQPRGGADEQSSDISDADIRRIIADPMFPSFAKGRKEELSTLCRDFCAMLEAGGDVRKKTNLDPSVLMRVTPRTDGTVMSGVTLTERQRMLAREAGMSYREYYDMILGIPENKRL